MRGQFRRISAVAEVGRDVEGDFRNLICSAMVFDGIKRSELKVLRFSL